MTAQQDADLHTTAGKLADLARRTDEAAHAGSARAIEKQHSRGKKTARERIGMLLDPGSFVELDELARHRSTAFGLDQNRPYGDGVVTGHGTVDGRQVCVFSQDFTVFGGSLGEVFGEKIVKVLDLAMKIGCPDRRDQRLRRRTDPGGRGRARSVRRHLLPQRPGQRRHPADLADHGPVRGRGRLLPGDHRLHGDGRPDLAHVHHRAGRDPHGDRRRRRHGGTGRRPDPQHAQRQRALPGQRRGRRGRVRPGPCCRTCRATTWTSRSPSTNPRTSPPDRPICSSTR